MSADQILHLVFRDSCNILWLYCGLLIASILEAWLWKARFFQPLNQPIHQTWFGANKRWRGLISLPLTNTLSTCLFQIAESVLLSTTQISISKDLLLFSDFNCIEYGLLIGFICNLAELPNSFIKRRLRMPPGSQSNFLFYFADHMDSALGVILLWYFYFNFPLHSILTALAISPLLFMGATRLRKKLGLK